MWEITMFKIKKNLGRQKTDTYFSEIREKFNKNISRNFQFRHFERASNRPRSLEFIHK